MQVYGNEVESMFIHVPSSFLVVLLRPCNFCVYDNFQLSVTSVKRCVINLLQWQTGYGPRSRLIFDRDERRYELWEAKFYGHLHTLKLKKELEKDVPDAGKNADVFAELMQLLDDRSLALVMRDAKDDGKKALQILKKHYMSQGKRKVIVLCTELTTLEKGEKKVQLII